MNKSKKPTQNKSKKYDRNAAIAEILHEAQLCIDDCHAGDERGRQRLSVLFEMCGFAAVRGDIPRDMVYVAIEAILPMHVDSMLRLLVDHAVEMRGRRGRRAA